MIIEIVNEVGAELVNMDLVERIIQEDTRLQVLHLRNAAGKQWTDTYQFNSREALQVEYMNIKEQLADLNQLSGLRPHRLRPAAPVLQMDRPMHNDAVDRGWTEGDARGPVVAHVPQEKPAPGQDPD